MQPRSCRTPREQWLIEPRHPEFSRVRCQHVDARCEQREDAIRRHAAQPKVILSSRRAVQRLLSTARGSRSVTRTRTSAAISSRKCAASRCGTSPPRINTPSSRLSETARSVRFALVTSATCVVGDRSLRVHRHLSPVDLWTLLRRPDVEPRLALEVAERLLGIERQRAPSGLVRLEDESDLDPTVDGGRQLLDEVTDLVRREGHDDQPLLRRPNHVLERREDRTGRHLLRGWPCHHQRDRRLRATFGREPDRLEGQGEAGAGQIAVALGPGIEEPACSISERGCLHRSDDLRAGSRLVGGSDARQCTARRRRCRTGPRCRRRSRRPQGWRRRRVPPPRLHQPRRTPASPG